MTAEEREEIRDHIRKEIQTLERSVTTLLELTEPDVQSDANDWFSSKESNPSKEINELALVKARQKLVMLKNVLSEIDSSEFGICIKCNKPIPLARLKLVPSAKYCVSC